MDRINLGMIVPEAVVNKWKNQFQKSDLISYKRNKNGSIALAEKFRIMKFLRTNDPWQVIISPSHPPKMASIWGRFVAKINFDRGAVISIERMRLKDFLRIILDTPVFFIRALFFLPEKDASFSK
jgi:hypothetical protein